MRHHLLDCVDVEYNCLLLIPEYYEKLQIDTVLQLLDYWEEHCETSLLINRTRLLLSIQQQHFNEKIYDERIIYYLVDYRDQFESVKELSTETSISSSKMDSACAIFDTFTVRLAERAYQQSPANTVNRLLANHFRGAFDSTFLNLQSLTYHQSDLQRYYWQTVDKVMNLNYVYYGLSTGLWLPQSKNIKGLGTHPEMGLFVGVANGRADANCHLFIRVGATSEPYTFTYYGKSFTTRQFLGGGVGFEWGVKLWYRMQSEIALHTGMVFDVYSPPESDEEYENKSISSLFFSPGLSFGWRPQKLGRAQFSLQGRYHIFLADLGELKGPQGNSLSLRLVFSYNWKDPRKNYLEQLSYQYQQ